MDDPVIRVLAINAFKRWCEWDWSRIVEEQPEKTVQAQTEIFFIRFSTRFGLVMSKIEKS